MLRPLRYPNIPLLLYFVPFYFLAALTLRYVSFRDPSSFFFNPHVAYTPTYSTIREAEASSYVLEYGTHPQRPFPSSNKSLCVAIPSVAREKGSYLRGAVGSLLEGLAPSERADIHTLVFIPHTDPTVHPAYSESWLANLVDEVLVYDLPQEEIQHLAHIEKDQSLFREKMVLDYNYALKRCYAHNTPYIAMLEDDVIAMDGWYHRSMAAIHEAESRSALEMASLDFLYLRLFYTEEFLGWNSEFWPTYLASSLLVLAVSGGFLVSLRYCLPSRINPINKGIILTVCLMYLPLCIILFFAAGRLTVFPLPTTGITKMNNFGCCSQGLLFPRHKAASLISWFEERKVGFADVLIEEYADKLNELRWAITPSVLQHVGRKSSKGDDFGSASRYHMSVAEKIWNFGFEMNSAKSLRREHENILRTSHENES